MSTGVTMDDTQPENDLRVERQRWSEACDSMGESSPKQMIRGGAEFQRQKVLNQAENNWKAFLGSTDTGLHRIEQAASTGAQSDLMDSTRWGWRCMLNFKKQTTGKNRLPQPGQLSFYLETAKAENF